MSYLIVSQWPPPRSSEWLMGVVVALGYLASAASLFIERRRCRLWIILALCLPAVALAVWINGIHEL